MLKMLDFFLHFFKLLPKISVFINHDDFTEKLHHIDQNIFSFYSKRDLMLIRKLIIFSEKMRNSDNYNYDYAHSFFGKDF